MSISKRFAPIVIGVLGAALALSLSVEPAQSRAPTVGELFTGCAQRVGELEAEVRALREQLRVQAASSSASERAFSLDQGASTRNLPECAIPFQISKAGIKRFKQQCLTAIQSLARCDVPFEIDARGVKTFKAGCL